MLRPAVVRARWRPWLACGLAVGAATYWLLWQANRFDADASDQRVDWREPLLRLWLIASLLVLFTYLRRSLTWPVIYARKASPCR